MPPCATGVPGFKPSSAAAAADSRASPLPSGVIRSGHLPGRSSRPTLCSSAALQPPSGRA